LPCNQRKGVWHHARHKNLCAQLSLELHQKSSETREESGLSTAQYITNLLIEYYEVQINS